MLYLSPYLTIVNKYISIICNTNTNLFNHLIPLKTLNIEITASSANYGTPRFFKYTFGIIYNILL